MCISKFSRVYKYCYTPLCLCIKNACFPYVNRDNYYLADLIGYRSKCIQ